MASERPSGDFGSKLRAARERRGISLRQIANATKIAVAVLEALERNDISRLPGGIFGRAFVRSYAVEVGLDPEDTIRDFMAQFPHDSVTVGHPTTEQIEDHDSLESDRRTASTFLRLIAVSLPIAAMVIYLGASGRLSPGRHAPETAPAAEAAAPTPAPTPEAATPAPPTPAPAIDAPAPTQLTVALAATGPCWLSVIVDGQKRVERTFAAGEQQTLQVRRELVLTAGDASAITWTINGAAAKPLGHAGEKVTARVSLANFKTFLAAR
jgi:cytoskeletal protein RodZ